MDRIRLLGAKPALYCPILASCMVGFAASRYYGCFSIRLFASLIRR